MTSGNDIQKQYEERSKRNKRYLIVEIAATCLLVIVVLLVGLNNLSGQAEQYANDVQNDYTHLMQAYTRAFDVAIGQLAEKLAEDPSVEEVDAWLKARNDSFAEAMGKEIYDGICVTWKGGFPRSWDFGDYSNYDPTTRMWYQVSEAAGGKTALIAPYVTYLDAQFLADDSYILMSIVRRVAPGVDVDLDLKIGEIADILQNRKALYNGVELMMYDKDGYILSSSDRQKFAHNVYKPDGVISQSLSDVLRDSEHHDQALRLTSADGVLFFLYTDMDDHGHVICMGIPFLSVFLQDFLFILLIMLFMIVFEVCLYRKEKHALTEAKGRDERLTAITRAAFRYRLYVRLDSMTFYGEKKAAAMFPGDAYEALFAFFRDRVTDDGGKESFTLFVSPVALRQASENMYHLEAQKFTMDWPQPDKTSKTRTIEVSRLLSVIDGAPTAGLLCRDVSEDAEILKEALKQAESASRAKGDFMSRMSHEIRTPLNAVIGYLDIAKEDIRDPEKVVHCLDQSSVAAKHLLNILNDVLDISTIESGRMKIDHADFDLTRLINALTTIFYEQAKKKHIDFSVQVNDLTEEWLRGDSLRLNQILMNLLSNALKFTPEKGKVTLDIHQIGIHEGKVHLQFSVSDTGIGMSEAFMKRIYTPFEQENTATARNYGGTGLGLSICMNLVKLMGGSMQVESNQGQGATFIVTMAFDLCEGKHVESIGTQSFSKLRALVVDDDESSCEYITRLLERCGVKCDAVTSGKKAVRRVKNRMTSDYPYDFCIVDWHMAEMDGMETSRQIKALCGKDMPIIIATAYDYSAIVDQAKTVGINHIVSKPLFQSSMFDLLVNTFGKYEPAQSKEDARGKVDFHGMRVLLAEDNAMNMEIAVDILSRAGLKVTQTVNGKEAVDSFMASEPNTFDAILMDIQMPVMDGYEATRVIRHSEHPQAKTIPIIAMTANAFTSDVTEALSAGMNDHIAKPVSYARLYDALLRLTQPGEQ